MQPTFYLQSSSVHCHPYHHHSPNVSIFCKRNSANAIVRALRLPIVYTSYQTKYTDQWLWRRMNDKQLRDDNGGIRIASLGLSSCDDALLWMTAALSMQCRAPLQRSIDGLLIQSPPLNNNKLSGEFHSIAITRPPIAISSLSPNFTI